MTSSGVALIDHGRGDLHWTRRADRGDVRARFWALVDKSGDCWIWTGAQGSTGYGVFNVGGGRLVSAHRYAYELTHGPVPVGHHVCHRCDTKLCVEPAHLFAGTPAQNLEDARSKGRLVVGERHPFAKLTNDQVTEIRALAGTMSQGELAARYGVTRSHIGRIVRGTSR